MALSPGVTHPGNGGEQVLACEIIDIRRFDAEEFTPLLEAESRAWRDELRWDFTSSARVVSTCLREKRLSGYALLLEGKIQGCCFFFYEGEKGLIGDLFVEPSCAGVAEALQLLEHVSETLLGTPGLRRVEAQLPHFSFAQLEPCFRARGFLGYLRRFMAASLLERPRFPTPAGTPADSRVRQGVPPLDDFVTVAWERRHDREAAQLLYNAYRQHVDAIINDQYSSLAGAGRLLENIVHHQWCGQCLPGVSRVAIHRPTQTLAGILAVTSVLPHTAHIPQVAVAKPYQGSGLGTALLEAAFQELARQGYRDVSLTVTDANAGAVRLYERLGFETFRSFGAFVFNRP
jgi:ribosomal protein S18 acetylase RimI-like enzyme